MRPSNSYASHALSDQSSAGTYSYENRKVRKAIFQWFNSIAGVPVTFVFHQHLNRSGHIEHLTRQIGEKTIQVVRKRLGKTAVGKQRLKRNGVPFDSASIWEISEEAGLHAHCTFETIDELSSFEMLMRLREIAPRYKWIKRIHVGDTSSPAWTNYILKKKHSGLLSDHIDLVNTQLPIMD